MTSSNPVDLQSRHARKILALFVMTVLGVGVLIGSTTETGGWYENLQKPVFNPPNWIFGPVWSCLYVLIAVAGWRTYQHCPRGRLWQVWCVQMVLNFAWTPIFFRLHLIWPAFLVLAILLCLVSVFIVSAWQRDRTAAWLFMPYAVWVGFAGLLNLTIAILN
ncbi:TspO/MBR family protein [Labrenzia sp. VG12]|uniref:TspO/MBR family protein n=1 Tax=Labrenzia sp. VG12 TaxID=2021862 RepID=UPI0018DFFDEF|nr:TspO/MBR family protein [Labrenzia sp. VG12]